MNNLRTSKAYEYRSGFTAAGFGITFTGIIRVLMHAGPAFNRAVLCCGVPFVVVEKQLVPNLVYAVRLFASSAYQNQKKYP